jgi:hypothetical protein
MAEKKIKEQIDYGDYPERMDPSIQRKLEKGETPYSEHPAMPSGEKNFDQIVASKRFKDVVDKFQRYAGTRTPLRHPNAMMVLMQSAMGMVMKINQIEQNNAQYLENLAIDLVKKQMGVPEGSINYDAKLVPLGQLEVPETFRSKAEEFDKEEIEDAFEQNLDDAEEHSQDLLNFEDAFEKFDMEKAKRRFMNSLIQGASKKGHYMFELVADEIERVNPELLQLYGVSMASLDYLYWLYPEQMVQTMAASGAGQAGNEEVNMQTDPPTVKARAISFPILVHELLKGTYEILGAHGLPDDPRQREMVMASEDTLPAEIWDIRLGPIFWEKFLEAYPDKLFDDDMKHIQNYLFSRFSMLSASEFLDMAKSILSGSPKGKESLKRMVDDIVADLKKQDYESALGDEESYEDEDEDDDLDWLKDLGIDV